MFKTVGKVFMLLGALMILASAGLHTYNCGEDRLAADTAARSLSELRSTITAPVRPENTDPTEISTLSVEEMNALLEAQQEMPVVKVNGMEYIGYLNIPSLELELPVQSEWDYGRLKKSPCCYYGSWKSHSLVIAAHNFQSHFGKLKQLRPDDLILFTDAEDGKHLFKVADVTQVQPTDIPLVQDTVYDLVLYTCTPGGRSRVVVYCTETTLEAVSRKL